MCWIRGCRREKERKFIFEWLWLGEIAIEMPLRELSLRDTVNLRMKRKDSFSPCWQFLADRLYDQNLVAGMRTKTKLSWYARHRSTRMSDVGPRYVFEQIVNIGGLCNHYSFIYLINSISHNVQREFNYTSLRKRVRDTHPTASHPHRGVPPPAVIKNFCICFS